MGAETKSGNPIVFLEFRVRDDRVGRVVFELDVKSAPRACENFRALCTGERGIGEAGHPLHFRGSTIHKVVGNILVQGGDITNNDGSGGDTIYGRIFSERINPEGLKFDHSGILGLANSADRREENTSQFFITLDLCPHLEGTNVAFGKVLKGLNVVREISNLDDGNTKPMERIDISDCGQIQPGEDWGYAEKDGTPDVYPPYPDDWEAPEQDVAKAAGLAAANIRDSGNVYFADRKFRTANRKYDKALRYLDWAKVKNKNVEVDRELYTTCLLNIGATKLNLNNYLDTRRYCNAVIGRDPNSAKAYFRRGKANFELNDYDAAINDLKQAYELDPNSHIHAEIVRVENVIKHYLQEEKKTFAAMMKPS